MNSKRSGTHYFSSLAVLVLSSVALAAQPSQPAAQPSDSSNGGSNGGMSDPYRGYGNEYPAAEVQAIPSARANAVRARLEMELTQTNLHRWIDRAWDDFMNSKDYLDAGVAEKKAQDDYARERDRVLKKLNDDANYHALGSIDLPDLREKIDRNRPSDMKNANQNALDNMMAQAMLKLGYSSTMRAMETAALDADSGVKDARAKLVDASAKSRVMRHNFDRGVRRDPEFLASRARVDEAKINTVVASVFLDSAINARETALDYAYYVHRWDQYRYSTSQYDPYGYGNVYSGYSRRY